MLYSIEKIEKIYDTSGSNPVEVHCNDFNNYICKYDSTNKLLNEHLAHRFLQIWDIPVPPSSFVTVHNDHVPIGLHPRIQRHRFTRPLFGSKRLEYSLDFNDFFTTLRSTYQLSKINGRYETFLKIALFDLWIANTDRNANNMNLLLNSEGTQHVITAIDHTDIFDGCRLGGELAHMTYEDSILYSTITKVLMPSSRKCRKETKNILNHFYFWVQECGRQLPRIFHEVPQLWNLDHDTIIHYIQQSIIENQRWNQEIETNFKQYVEMSIR
ncbi:MAG TPA: HipA family kinase [Bacteroidia bacterium]|nr:HipA family kinase [Bacteroidia bacterium]